MSWGLFLQGRLGELVHCWGSFGAAGLRGAGLGGRGAVLDRVLSHGGERLLQGGLLRRELGGPRERVSLVAYWRHADSPETGDSDDD